MKKNGLVWKFLEPQVVETSDHTNKTNKILPQSNKNICRKPVTIPTVQTKIRKTGENPTQFNIPPTMSCSNKQRTT